MNTRNIKLIIAIICLLLAALVITARAQEATKPTIALVNIDCKNPIQVSGATIEPDDITYLVRLELEKTGLYTVMDRYEMKDKIGTNEYVTNDCFSKSCMVNAGKLLGVDKMLTGSVETPGNKIVITLRLIDVASGTVEKSNVTEYLKLSELQKMIRISIQRTLGIESDPVVVNQLIDYDVPIQSPKNAFKLNGPRMGFSYLMGDEAKIAAAPVAKGGFNMYPVAFEFGWQQEIQYISAGSFQALIENVFLIGGLESGRAIPSYTPLLGFRFGKNAWEFAFGPTFKLVAEADGFYDTQGLLGATGDWHLQGDWAKNKPNTPFPNDYYIQTRLDSRGPLTVSTGLVIAAGRTFHSGYLNIPVNLHVAPRRDGVSAGLTFGFNIQKKRHRW